MSLVDNDLLSIQEARILLEHAEESQESLEGLPATLINSFLATLRDELLPRCAEYAQNAVQESDYGCAEDDAALTQWVLQDMLAEVSAEISVQSICVSDDGCSATMNLSKGVVLSLVPDWLSVSVLLSQVICAIKSKSPIIISVRPRVHTTCQRVMDDIVAVAEQCHYPAKALGFLSLYSAEGEAWLSDQERVRVLIDGRDYEHLCPTNTHGKDVYYASVGNNPVFVERSADLAQCAEQVVAGASWCCGMLPGAEQSIVAETAIAKTLKRELEQRGCYFLSEQESRQLIHILFDENGCPHRELIAKTACDLARRADIIVPDTTRVLAVEKPYVSERSLYSGVKYGPVVSFYVEETWRAACEKCIELILNNGHGNALSIFSNDSEVIRQFILKKPVGRILVNMSTGLGTIGYRSHLPKTLTIAGWDFATTSEPGVSYRDFVRERQVGTTCEDTQVKLLHHAAQFGETCTTEPCSLPLHDSSSAALRADAVTPATSDSGASVSDDWFSSLLESVQEH